MAAGLILFAGSRTRGSGAGEGARPPIGGGPRPYGRNQKI